MEHGPGWRAQIGDAGNEGQQQWHSWFLATGADGYQELRSWCKAYEIFSGAFARIPNVEFWAFRALVWGDWRATCSRMPVCHVQNLAQDSWSIYEKEASPRHLLVSSDRSKHFSWNPCLIQESETTALQAPLRKSQSRERLLQRQDMGVCSLLSSCGDGNPGIAHFCWRCGVLFLFRGEWWVVIFLGTSCSYTCQRFDTCRVLVDRTHLFSAFTVSASCTGLGGWSCMLRTFGMWGVERLAKPKIEILED